MTRRLIDWYKFHWNRCYLRGRRFTLESFGESFHSLAILILVNHIVGAIFMILFVLIFFLVTGHL